MSAPVRITLGVPNDSQPIPVVVSSNKQRKSINVTAPISAGKAPEYDGSYSVTPTEQEQTLQTNGFLMKDDVSVDSIPSDYVGSAIPRRTKNDINITKIAMPGGVQTPVAIAAKGYYGSNTTKNIPTGKATTPATSITANPTVSVDSNGLVTASVSASQSVTPTVNEGYVMSGTAGTVSVQGNSTLHLSTQAGETITPTESEQTAVAAQKFTTGEVKVAAIPSNYVGSSVPTQAGTTITPSESEQTAVESGKYTTGEVKVGAISSSYVGSGVTRNDSTDLSVSGATVTAPAGYYENAASASVQNATWKNASAVGVVPEISVDANGLITANAAGWTSIHPLTASGYADADTAANIQLAGSRTSQLATLGATTYTPAKGSPTIITPGKYLTGDQTISAIPDTWYDMSGAMSWLGADATLVHEITPITVALKDTDFNTWTPSTTAATVVASQTLSGSTQKYVATDLLLDGGYNYINIWCMKLPVVYTGSPTNKALSLFSCGLLVQTIFRRYSSYTNLLDGNMNNNVTAQTTLATFERYYNSSSSLTYTNAASYGFYFANVAPTISSATAQSPTITLKTPTMSARCSTTYLSTANCGLVDKTNTKLTITCKVYRVKQDCYLQGYYRYLAARVAEMDT